MKEEDRVEVNSHRAMLKHGKWSEGHKLANKMQHLGLLQRHLEVNFCYKCMCQFQM